MRATCAPAEAGHPEDSSGGGEGGVRSDVGQSLQPFPSTPVFVMAGTSHRGTLVSARDFFGSAPTGRP